MNLDPTAEHALRYNTRDHLLAGFRNLLELKKNYLTLTYLSPS
jgi:hypothetical protein